MNIIENFRSAIFNILSSKMRTILTTLGIIIGITSVVVITSIGKGFENQINESFSGISTDSISVSTSYGETIRDKDKFTLEDLKSVKNLANVNYAEATYNLNASVTLKNPKETADVGLYGTTPDLKNINKIEMLFGRFIEERDVQSKAKVCVLDNKLAIKIFGRQDVLGERILVKTIFGSTKEIELEVIGVYKNKNEDSLFASYDIYSPIKTVMEFDGNKDETYNNIKLTLKDTKLFDGTKKEILRVLSTNHNNNPKKYSVSGNFQVLDSMSGTIKIFTIFVGFVAGISLLVGGIGVMNIMLVTVTERTREIGIRKSLGATNNNIKFQFLIEAITISMLGGIVGVLLGYLGTFVTWQVLKVMGNTLVPTVSMPVVLGSVIISSLIGVIFGVYPAGKAAKLDPIEALRYE